jgi:YVTN family beta-propeller protein
VIPARAAVTWLAPPARSASATTPRTGKAHRPLAKLSVLSLLAGGVALGVMPVAPAAAGGSTPTAYVVNTGDGTVTPINTATHTTGSPIVVGSAPAAIAITPDGTIAYVANQRAGSVTPFATATNFAYSSIGVGSGPDAVAISPDGTTAYVANRRSGTVTPINTATRVAGKPIRAGSTPAAISITPNGNTAYVANVANCGSGTVTPINLTTDTAGAPIVVGVTPVAISITPNGTTAYVVNRQSGTVTPISTATNTAGTPITVGKAPSGIAITPDGTTAYVANSGSGTVTPISTASNTAGTPIAVGKAPSGIAITPDDGPMARFKAQHIIIHRYCGFIEHFDATISVVPGAPIIKYAWTFGDGGSAATTGPYTYHNYSSPGIYTATLTETDADGTSTQQVFTGQTVSLNGGPAATTSASVGGSGGCVR